MVVKSAMRYTNITVPTKPVTRFVRRYTMTPIIVPIPMKHVNRFAKHEKIQCDLNKIIDKTMMNSNPEFLFIRNDLQNLKVDVDNFVKEEKGDDLSLTEKIVGHIVGFTVFTFLLLFFFKFIMFPIFMFILG